MKKKDEQITDSRLRKLGVTPRIYHFVNNVEPLTAIIIADDVLTWTGARREVDRILKRYIRKGMLEPATKLKALLRTKGLYGVAVCYGHDQFNRQRGRTIAKGKLAKYLRQLKGERK